MELRFSKSEAYEARYPGLAFGLALLSGCANPEDAPDLGPYKKKLLRKMRKREVLAGITERIETYDRFFESFGYECPLPGHLKRTVNSGFPKYNLMVDAHFLAEMCAGILVAVTDFDRIDGALTLDVAVEGERFDRMGGVECRTKEGEIVLRDEKEIICILCQGADEKTRVGDKTSNVLFYAYAVPGIDADYLEDGLSTAADTMIQFTDGKKEFLEVY